MVFNGSLRGVLVAFAARKSRIWRRWGWSTQNLGASLGGVQAQLVAQLGQNHFDTNLHPKDSGTRAIPDRKARPDLLACRRSLYSGQSAVCGWNCDHANQNA